MARRRRRKQRPVAPDFLAATAPAGAAAPGRPGPQAGQLLADVVHLRHCAEVDLEPSVKAVFARAAIVMAAAAIEAATNDALAAIFALMTDAVAPDDARRPPWRHFRGRSSERVALLMRRGAWGKRHDYVLETIARTLSLAPPADLPEAIKQLMRVRNRIVHMNYLRERGETAPLLSPADLVAQARIASDTATRHVAFLRAAFAAMELPIAGEAGEDAVTEVNRRIGANATIGADKPAHADGVASRRRRRGRNSTTVGGPGG